MRRRPVRWGIAGAAVLGAFALVGTACSEYRVERQGKDFGEAMCDLKNADNEEEVREAAEDAQNELEDAARIAGRPIGEDVDDVEENLADLAAHVIDDQPALVQQDIAAIRRNVEAAASRADGVVQRFYEGTVQGLGDCSD
jgi:hypothetical protein